ncbi:MAG: hypothetical protein ACRDTZ_09125, partial [Pseudonocardiaceae bacterium]
PTWSYLDFRGDVDAALAELEELKIPWGDAPLQEAKRKARGSSWGTQVVQSALEVWRRHADPEEKSLVGVISPIDTLHARRLRDDLETATLQGFA